MTVPDVPRNLHPAVVPSLKKWHDMIAAKDLSDLASIVHPNAVFRSPMAISPYASRAAVVLLLETVVTVLQDFEYHRQLVTDDGLSVVLELSARVGDKRLKGIDLIRFDTDGMIVDFEVMIRPMSGLQALGGEMGRRLKDKLPQFKAKI